LPAGHTEHTVCPALDQRLLGQFWQVLAEVRYWPAEQTSAVVGPAVGLGDGRAEGAPSKIHGPKTRKNSKIRGVQRSLVQGVVQGGVGGRKNMNFFTSGRTRKKKKKENKKHRAAVYGLGMDGGMNAKVHDSMISIARQMNKGTPPLCCSSDSEIALNHGTEHKRISTFSNNRLYLPLE
jgi:hypothetical protein